MPATANADGLTDKEQVFAREYLKDFNKAQAAIRTGYSENTAKEIGYELLTKPHVRQAIREIQRERARRLDLDGDWAVLQFFDVYESARDKGDDSAALKALENIAKYLGIYEADNRQKSGVSNIEALKAKLASRGVKVDREPSKN